MVEQLEILRRYAGGDMNERLHLFLQFPDLRNVFQEIEGIHLTGQMGSISLNKQHNAGKCSQILSLLGGVYDRVIERKIRPKCLDNPRFPSMVIRVNVEGIRGRNLRI